jgi:signal transduction histidine kinase
LPEKRTTTDSRHLDERRKFVSEAFHSFHQPLTALHCGIELSLLKQRTEEEYRRRLQDALVSAGAVLQLNKALRELVESADPGENFGRVDLQPLLSRLAEQLSYIAESALVAIRFSCLENIFVGADPLKLSANIAHLATIAIGSLEPGASVHLKVHADETVVLITIAAKGMHREPPDGGVQQKIDAIRADAACNYCWTVGGEFRKTKAGFTIALNSL